MSFEDWMARENVIGVRVVGRQSVIERVEVGLMRDAPAEAARVAEILMRLVGNGAFRCKEQGGWTAHMRYHPAIGFKWSPHVGDFKREDGMGYPGHFEVGQAYDLLRERLGITLGRLWFDLDMEHAHLESWRPRTTRSPEATVN